MDFDLKQYITAEALNSESVIGNKLAEIRGNISDLDNERKQNIKLEHSYEKELKKHEEIKKEKSDNINKLKKDIEEYSQLIKDITKKKKGNSHQRSKIKTNLEEKKKEKIALEQERQARPEKYNKSVSEAFSEYLKVVNGEIILFYNQEELFKNIQKDKQLVENNAELSQYIKILDIGTKDEEIIALAKKKIKQKYPNYFDKSPDKDCMFPLYYYKQQESNNIIIFFPILMDFDNQLSCQSFYKLVGMLYKDEEIDLLPFEKPRSNKDFFVQVHLKHPNLEGKVLEIKLDSGRDIQFIFEILDEDVTRSIL